MKLSMELYTHSEKFGDFRAVEMLKEAGFDAFDYSYYYNKEQQEVLSDNYIEYAKKLREHIDKVGISCTQAHAPFSYQYGDGLTIEDKKYREIVRAIESAAILGAKNIIVHSVKVPKDIDFEEYNIEFYKSFIPYCEKAGICVAVENLFIRDPKRRSFITRRLGSPEALNAIIEKINSPYIVACVDVGHAALTGYEPEDFIEGIKPEFLKALHIQDTDYIDDRHVIPFAGDFNWEAIMKALKKSGYEGDMTMEIIKYINRFPDELFAEATKFAATIGKHLISIFEGAN